MHLTQWKVFVSFLGLLVIGCASGGGHAEDGTYSLPHEIDVFDGESWHTTPVEDMLKLTSTRDGNLEFELNITATNLHTCQMEGTASRAGDSFEYRDHPGEYGEPGDEPCLLRITPTPEAIIVDDVGNRCRMVWCGVRAAIGRTVFPRKPQPPENGPDSYPLTALHDNSEGSR